MKESIEYRASPSAGRARFVLVMALFVSAVSVVPGAAASSMMTCDACPVHLSWVTVPAPASPPGYRDIVSSFAVGEGAVAGTYSGRLETTVETVNQSAAPIVLHQPVTFDVSEGKTSSGTPLDESIRAGLDLEVGTYHVTVSFFGNDGDGERLWGRYDNNEVIIKGPTKLANGTGSLAAFGVNALDFAGDSLPDLWITRASDAQPANASVSLRASQWENEVKKGTTLSGSVQMEGAAGRHEVRVDGAALATVFAGVDLRRVSIQVFPDDNTWRWDDAGDLIMAFEHRDSDSTSSSDPHAPPPPRTTDLSFELVFARAQTAPPTQWPVGHQATLNVSAWDLDEEGTPDVFFYHSSAALRSEAEASTVEQRRSTPIQLWLRLNVTEQAAGRLVEVLLDRISPPVSEGAWVELRNFSSLFGRLLKDDPERYADEPQISLAMEPDEGFVADEGPDVWLWVGHFSTQKFSVLLPIADPAPRSGATPSIAPAGIMLAATVAAWTRRHGT